MIPGSDAAGPRSVAAGALAIAMLNMIGITVLFGAEACILAISLDWSIAGLLHLPPAVYLPLGAIPLAAALAATAWIAKRSWRYERDHPGT